MRYLFIHQSFPGQYQHVALALAADPANEVVFLTRSRTGHLPGVRTVAYRPGRAPSSATHPYLHRLEAGVLNGQAVLRAGQELRRQGFHPDIIIGHTGWGETLYVKDLWPDVPLLGYIEFFYHATGSDLDFDPEYPLRLDDLARLRTNNALHLLGLDAVDWGQCPTLWQRSRQPSCHHDVISVIHEGVDTTRVRPDPDGRLVLNDGALVLTRRDEVVTYVARNLEPYRGFHVLMRALPALQRRRPKAHIVVVGGDGVSYGHAPPGGRTFRQKMMDEVGGSLDRSRLHFLGPVPYDTFLNVLKVSSVHIYLTYPFVLSWSVLEAMAAGCAVVGSATPPVAEVIRDGDNGLLVDFFATDALAEAVAQLLADPPARARLGAHARQTILDHYDLNGVCLPRHLDLIATLIDGRRPETLVEED